MFVFVVVAVVGWWWWWWWRRRRRRWWWWWWWWRRGRRFSWRVECPMFFRYSIIQYLVIKASTVSVSLQFWWIFSDSRMQAHHAHSLQHHQKDLVDSECAYFPWVSLPARLEWNMDKKHDRFKVKNACAAWTICYRCLKSGLSSPATLRSLGAPSEYRPGPIPVPLWLRQATWGPNDSKF